MTLESSTDDDGERSIGDSRSPQSVIRRPRAIRGLDDAAAAAPPRDMTEREAEASIGGTLGLTRGDQRFLWIAGLALLMLCVMQWARLSGFGQREVEISRLPARRFDFRVDINRATWVEWMQLESIGEVTARKIVADRETRGAFRSVDDVDRVPGIGPKTLAAIRPWLTCSDCVNVGRDDAVR